MKTYKLIENDVLKLAPDDGDIADGLEARPVEALALYSETGDLVGVRLPDIAVNAPRKRTSEEIQSAHQEFIRAIQAIPKLTPPEGKPLDLKRARSSEPLADDDEIYAILESLRKPEPWTNPFDLSI